MNATKTAKKIWASMIRPGMVVRTEAGERVEIEKTIEGYSTWTLIPLCGPAVTVEYGETVEVLGHFNI